MSTDIKNQTEERTDARLLVLHVLRIAGFADAERIAGRTGLEQEQVRSVLDQANADGLAVERTGPISGWTLSSVGQALHARLLSDEQEQRGSWPAVERGDDAFLGLNEPFKAICTRWQLHPDGRPNNHADKDYDRAVVGDLHTIHARIVVVTDGVAAALPRFAQYARRFASALHRLDGGDRTAFTTPLAESYHDVWMELHQDFLCTSGRARSTADGH